MATIQPTRPSLAQVACMAEFGASDFRALHATLIDESRDRATVWRDVAEGRAILATARMIREAAAIFAPSFLP